MHEASPLDLISILENEQTGSEGSSDFDVSSLCAQSVHAYRWLYQANWHLRKTQYEGPIHLDVNRYKTYAETVHISVKFGIYLGYPLALCIGPQSALGFN